MGTGAWVLVAALVVAAGFAAYRAAADGRFRGTRRVRRVAQHNGDPAAADSGPAATLAGIELGERATLLQFSSAFCTPCRAARRVLADVASTTPGVRHVEVDAEQHLDLVRHLGVLRTPTTLVLATDGTERLRASGVPSRAQVVVALAQLEASPGSTPREVFDI